MASETIIDLDGLLSPLSEELPAGEDIRLDYSPTSPYQIVKNARNSARAAERKNLFDGVNTEANDHWRVVLDNSPRIIDKHSKDLEIACWYTEALIRRHGFQGLRDGFKLIHGLLENYWEPLFPLPDEDGMETRVAPLAGLNGEGSEGVIIAPIRNVTITEGESSGPYSYWQYQQAREIQRLPDEDVRERKIADLGFGLSDIEKAVNESSAGFFIDLRDDLQACIDTFKAIHQLLDGYCDSDVAPPSSHIQNTLSELLGAINHLGKDKFPVAEEEPEGLATEDGDAPVANENPKDSATLSGPIKNREAAFRQLTVIAEFFRKTEPHSPISYVLEKAVRWGDMPLSELIAELIPDSSSREHYSTLTGVNTEE